ncbi:MAG: tryptophanase [Euryarchaeota archaeon]|nr:tryptophanase [Euryarchaeota archaeon]
MRPPPEPFRVKTVERIRLTTREERARLIRDAGFNPFLLRAEHVYIDLLTDSGTGAMSDEQWSAIMRGDEAYAGSRSFYELEAAVREVMGFKRVIPVHQGRGAERVVAEAVIRPGSVIPGNAHFDTTKAQIEHKGGAAVDCTIDEARVRDSKEPFKGNVDIAKLEAAVKRHGKENIPYVLVTVTCNTVGGQPVSMANLRAVREATKRHGIPLFLDMARYAENCWFIREREPSYGKRSVVEIAHEMSSLADAGLMSAKKNALVNIGGLILTQSDDLYERFAPFAVLHEGFLTYGGLAGRDLAAMAVGLKEAADEDFLRHRVAQVEYLAEKLVAAGVPVITPPGGHAVFVDAGAFLPHIPAKNYPGHALALALYVEAGVRAVEIGTLMAGRDPKTGDETGAAVEMLRLAIPARVYSTAHLDYVADAFREVARHKAEIRGVRFAKESRTLRHFTSRFEMA